VGFPSPQNGLHGAGRGKGTAPQSMPSFQTETELVRFRITGFLDFVRRPEF
jgi:hypothetical protein